MATEQGIKSLKFFDRKKKQLYNDTDLSAGVDHNNNNNDNDNNNNNDNDSNVDDEYDDTNIDELIDDEERPSTTQYKPNNNDDVNEEERGNNNVASEHIDEEPEQTDVISEKDEDDVDGNESEDNNDEVMDLRRSKRARTEPNNLSPTWKGKSYLQAVTGNMSTDPRKVEMCHNLVTQVVKDENRNEYTDRTVKVIARSMDEIRNNVLRDGSSFAQQYYLKKGLDKFGDAGRKAAMKELDQLYRRNCFEPISIKEMSGKERARAQETLLFLTEKRDGTIKGRAVYNGKETRNWLTKEEAYSPTAAIESVMILSLIHI